MKLSNFDIDFIKFKNEKDIVRFKIDDTFFLLKENSLYNHGDIDIKIQCEKNDGAITLNYKLNGHIASQCERCLLPIKIGVNSDRNEVLKLTLNDELLQEEDYLSVNHQVYSAYDSIYEQICLSLPTRLICESSISNKICEIDHPETTEENVVDDRWSELKKLIK